VRRTLPALVLAGLALAGCSGDPAEPATLPPGSNAPPPVTATTAAAPTTAAPTAEPTAGTVKSPIRWLGAAPAGAAAPVAGATRAYWSMVVRLAERPDPADPALPGLAAEPQLSKLVTLFTTVRADRISQRGPVDGTVTVAVLSAARATARTCLDQTLTRVYDATGKARAGSAGTLTLFTVTLARTGGAWKVTGVTSKDNACSTR
jgi:hypothetical protein